MVILALISSTSIKPVLQTINKDYNSERYLCYVPQGNDKNDIITLRVSPTTMCIQGIYTGSCTLVPNGEYSKAS